MIRIEDLALSILTKTTVIPEFKSKDGDLNEFLMQEAKDYQEQLLAVTYLLQNPKTGDIVAYFPCSTTPSSLRRTTRRRATASIGRFPT